MGAAILVILAPLMAIGMFPVTEWRSAAVFVMWVVFAYVNGRLDAHDRHERDRKRMGD